MMKILFTFLLFPFLLLAQDEKPEEPLERKKQGPFKGGMFKDREARFERLKKIIQEKHPDRYEELMKLKEEDPEHFKEEMRKTMKELSEKFGKMKPPMGGMHGKPGGERHWLRDMSEKNPERYEELMQLRKDNPEKFREQIAKEFSNRMKKRSPMDPKSMEAIKSAVRQYHEADDGQKEAAKENLRKLLEDSFEKDLNHRREMAERLEKHLAEVKRQIEEREKQSQSVVEDRLNFLINKSSTSKKDDI